MSINSMYGDDDDILQEAAKVKQSKHKKSISEIRGPNGEKLPAQLQEALSEYIDTSRAEAEAATPIEFRAIAGVLDQWSKLSDFQIQGAALVAVCEMLDILTDGQLSLLARYHETRRKIIYSKLVEKNIRTIMGIIDPGDTQGYLNEMWSFLEVYLDFVYFVQENAISEYRYLSGVCEREVDESFIETGIISQRSYWERSLFGAPAAFEDED